MKYKTKYDIKHNYSIKDSKCFGSIQFTSIVDLATFRKHFCVGGINVFVNVL